MRIFHSPSNILIMKHDEDRSETAASSISPFLFFEFSSSAIFFYSSFFSPFFLHSFGIRRVRPAGRYGNGIKNSFFFLFNAISFLTFLCLLFRCVLHYPSVGCNWLAGGLPVEAYYRYYSRMLSGRKRGMQGPELAQLLIA